MTGRLDDVVRTSLHQLTEPLTPRPDLAVRVDRGIARRRRNLRWLAVLAVAGAVVVAAAGTPLLLHHHGARPAPAGPPKVLIPGPVTAGPVTVAACPVGN